MLKIVTKSRAGNLRAGGQGGTVPVQVELEHLTERLTTASMAVTRQAESSQAASISLIVQAECS